MYRFEFHQATYVLDTYIRKASKLMVKQLGDADKRKTHSCAVRPSLMYSI